MGEAGNTFSVATSNWEPAFPVHRFRHNAMATTFEVMIAGENAEYARQTAEEAFDEIDRLELELSRFIENSDVSLISGLAAGRSARVGIAAFECLRLAARVHAETGGAFDVTIGALAELYSRGGSGPPSAEDVARPLGVTPARLE